jgi:hypothetical protein
MVKKKVEDVMIAELKKVYSNIGLLENPNVIDLGNIYESAIQDARKVVDEHIQKWQTKKKS